MIERLKKWISKTILNSFYYESVVEQIVSDEVFNRALFLCAQEDKTPQDQAIRIVGEADEFRRAVNGDGDPREEAVDCLLDSLSLVEQQFRSSKKDLIEMFETKLNKYEKQLKERGRV